MLHSKNRFVNNHFANCYEEDGELVVDTLAAARDAARLLRAGNPENPSEGYYNGHATGLVELGLGEPWPAAAQAVIDAAGRRTSRTLLKPK